MAPAVYVMNWSYSFPTDSTSSSTGSTLRILYNYTSGTTHSGDTSQTVITEDLEIEIAEVEQECDQFKELALACMCWKVAGTHMHTLANGVGEWWDLNTYAPNTIRMAREVMAEVVQSLEEEWLL